MAESVPIKYMFSKLDFLTNPAQGQTFTAAYTTYSNYQTGQPRWTTLSTVQTDVYGNILGDGLILTGLAENTEYVIKFTNTLNRVFLFKFKTCTNVKLGDSPYYKKVLMPGQAYDWYVEGLDTIGLPTLAECEVYYQLNSKKSVTAPEEQKDNYGSMCSFIMTNSYFNPTTEDGGWNTIEDRDGYSFLGSLPGLQKDDSIRVVGFPSMQYTGSAYKFWKAYWVNAGGGGISALDVQSKCSSGNGVAFAFIIDDTLNQDACICGWDSNEYKKYEGGSRTSWKLYYTADNKLRTESYQGTNLTSVTSSQTFVRNKWYFISICIGDSGHTLYTMDPVNDDYSQGYTSEKVASCGADTTNSKLTDMVVDDNGLVKTITFAIPFLFGDATSKGVAISNIVLEPKFSAQTQGKSTLLQKVMNRGLYSPRIKMSGTSPNGSWEYLLPVKQSMGADTEKLSFIVPTDIFDSIEAIKDIPYNQVGNAKLEMLIDGEVTATQLLNGFDYTDVSTGNTVHVGGMVNPQTYIADSFRLKFSECEDPISALACYFFTKHGSWGGYNGGVNGHNIYFNAEGNLIMECHGDNYKGSLKGVSKEGKVRPYTGYGTDIEYSKNEFDHRTRADFVRTGTALVSNKYFQYGRMDVTMKIPLGTFGVCPALWYFHYIEIGETDSRYNQEPYSQRNAQGGEDDGHYRVVNNEIDIELPSHLTNGVLPSWSSLSTAYFDKKILDTSLHIGVASGTASEKGLWRLTNPENPNVKESWVKVSDTYNPRYLPTFQNVKFNNWLGELNAGNGWCLPSDGVTAEEYYYGTNDKVPNYKEEYLSKLTKGTSDFNGFADGNFHKWSIIWVEDRTVLLIDDVIITQNKGFVPFNQMKFTLAMWFPTMASVSNEDGVYGVKDPDGINGTTGGTVTYIDDTQNFIGTWAGNHADFEICQLEVSEIQYTKYKKGDTIQIGSENITIGDPPSCLGESFPESGLRTFES